MANLLARTAWVLLVALLPAGLAQAQGQSLGDFARKHRKERAQKSSTASPSKVFTNEDVDLRRVVIPSESPIDPENPEARARAVAAATATPGGGEELGGEEKWRNRFGHARYKLERSQREFSVLKDKLQINQVQYSSDPNQTLMQEYSRSNVTGLAEEIREKEQEIARHQQTLQDLRRELRRAGGPIGWSRTSARAPVTARPAAASSDAKVNPNDLPQDEDYWRHRFKAARAKVEEARRDQALLEDELALTMMVAARVPDPAERLAIPGGHRKKANGGRAAPSRRHRDRGRPGGTDEGFSRHRPPHGVERAGLEDRRRLLSSFAIPGRRFSLFAYLLSTLPYRLVCPKEGVMLQSGLLPR